jgi:hypothetical protein
MDSYWAYPPSCHADCDSEASTPPVSSKQPIGVDASFVGMTGRGSMRQWLQSVKGIVTVYFDCKGLEIWVRHSPGENMPQRLLQRLKRSLRVNHFFIFQYCTSPGEQGFSHNSAVYFFCMYLYRGPFTGELAVPVNRHLLYCQLIAHPTYRFPSLASTCSR